MNNGELKCQLAVFIFQKNSLKVDLWQISNGSLSLSHTLILIFVWDLISLQIVE